MPVVVVTGASAGVGRATAREFARQGYDVGLIARSQDRLDAAAREVRDLGMHAVAVSADVADASAVEQAANAIENDLGPIDVWVNNAIAAVVAPVVRTTPDELKRSTEVTYLGTAHGTLAALRRMRQRNRGTIINVGSTLAFRSLPLQAATCGAKAATRAFTDALRSELIHESSRINLTMVHLPAMNTPQFDWAMTRMGHRAQPLSPVYQPEVAARAIVFAASHHRRDIWVGWSTIATLLADRIAPGLADRVLARIGHAAQLSGPREPANAPDNLNQPVAGAFAAHGRFDAAARDTTWEIVTSRHRDAVVLVGLVGLAAALRHLGRRLRR